jgi:hypothetical protein
MSMFQRRAGRAETGVISTLAPTQVVPAQATNASSQVVVAGVIRLRRSRSILRTTSSPFGFRAVRDSDRRGDA